MRHIHVWPEAPTAHQDWIRLSARIERPGGLSDVLWFDVAPEWQASIAASSDAFAIATFFLGGLERADVHLHGSVSPSLLRNLEEVSLMWSLWRPGKYKPITLTADTEAEESPAQPHQAVACFSGGVDGSFTAYRHAKGLCGRQRRNLAAGLLVQGFDIRLDQTEEFARASLGAEKSLRSLALPLVRMRTNFRQLGLDWVDLFGAAMAASLSILKGRFGAGLIGSDERYDFFAARGSTPLVDPLFSSEAFRIVHDGAGFTRTQKVAMLSQWDEGVANLRVCWEGADPSRNCGRCEKCVRTIMNFRAVGAGLPGCFDRDAADEDIARMPVRSEIQLNELVAILEEVERNGRQGESWVRVLVERIARSRRGPSLAQRVRTRVALRTRLKAWQQAIRPEASCAS
jgi:hypothetical protein